MLYKLGGGKKGGQYSIYSRYIDLKNFTLSTEHGLFGAAAKKEKLGTLLSGQELETKSGLREG